MKPTSHILNTIKASIPSKAETLFKVPDITSISVKDLPNSSFGKGTYYIKKSQYGHWPIYKKVQNTKITTEIKRIEGDVLQFKSDLIKIANLSSKDVSANVIAGYVNVRGDQSETLKQVFDKYIGN